MVRFLTEERARRNELRLSLALEAAAMISFDWDVTRDKVFRFDPTISDLSAIEGEFSHFEAVKDAVHPEDRHHFCAAVQAAFTSEDGRFETEVRIIGPEGETRWFVEKGRVERDHRGQPLRLIGVAHDITDQKRAEEALKAADRRKDEFLATLAHELRNPLVPIHNVTHILKKRHDGPRDPDAALIAMVERQVDHLVRLVDDLLEISRISCGKIKLRRKSVGMATVLRDALEMCQPLIDKKGHRLTTTITSEPLCVVGDSVRLTQVVANLVNNAAKYTDPGGVIDVQVVREGDEAVLRVRDNGIGVDADMLPHLFDLFTQVESHTGDSQGGLGIGLALVRSVVELHGGSIEGHSEGLGNGSEFAVRLPLAKAHNALPT